MLNFDCFAKEPTEAFRAWRPRPVPETVTQAAGVRLAVPTKLRFLALLAGVLASPRNLIACRLQLRNFDRSAELQLHRRLPNRECSELHFDQPDFRRATIARCARTRPFHGLPAFSLYLADICHLMQPWRLVWRNNWSEGVDLLGALQRRVRFNKLKLAFSPIADIGAELQAHRQLSISGSQNANCLALILNTQQRWTLRNCRNASRVVLPRLSARVSLLTFQVLTAVRGCSYWCPAGTSDTTFHAHPCPAGRYGSGTGAAAFTDCPLCPKGLQKLAVFPLPLLALATRLFLCYGRDRLHKQSVSRWPLRPRSRRDEQHLRRPVRCGTIWRPAQHNEPVRGPLSIWVRNTRV